MNLVGDDADDLVGDVVQLLSPCRCCRRSPGCRDVVVDLCCCNCLMLNWKM